MKNKLPRLNVIWRGSLLQFCNDFCIVLWDTIRTSGLQSGVPALIDSLADAGQLIIRLTKM